jgi:hypothetical protein
MSERVRTVLSPFIKGIERGEIRFCRVGQQWVVDYRQPPDPLPAPQDKLVRASDWNEWARCRTCAGRWFSPVLMNGSKWYFCDGCLPPAQYPALGARPVD